MVNRIFALLAFALCCSFTHAEETVEIPLSEVWGLGFLETKQLVHLDRDRHDKHGNKPLTYEERGKRLINSKTYQLLRALDDMPHTEMKSGFAVQGEGRESLENTHAVLVRGQSVQNTFGEGNKLSAVFFTRMTEFMHLMRVERRKNLITIEYCLEPVGSLPHLSPKVAIIPLGTLPLGSYQVNAVGFTKKPDDRNSACEPIKDERMKNLICQPFEFTVVEKGANDVTHSNK